MAEPRETRRALRWVRASLAVWILLGPAGANADPNTQPSQDPDGVSGAPSESIETLPSSEKQPSVAVEPREQMTIPIRSSGAKGSPSLDALLKLPTGYRTQRPSAPSVAGASESEWRRRFLETRESLSEARQNLAATKHELDTAASSSGGSQWSIAPPSGGGGGGADASTSPLSFKLRQRLKANRADLEIANRNLRELKIQANLAGVPKSWRGSPSGARETPAEVGQLLD